VLNLFVLVELLKSTCCEASHVALWTFLTFMKLLRLRNLDSQCTCNWRPGLDIFLVCIPCVLQCFAKQALFIEVDRFREMKR